MEEWVLISDTEDSSLTVVREGSGSILELQGTTEMNL